MSVLFACLLLLFYAIATVSVLYHGDMRWRKTEPTLLPTQGIVNLPHHIGMVLEELAFDDAVSYTYLNVNAVTGIRTPVPRVTYLTL